MKRNIYSYSKLWMIFFVLMGAACTNQVEDAIPVSGQPIEFSVQSDWKEIPNTRSDDDKTQFGPNDQIRIFGFHNGDQKFMYVVDDSGKGKGQLVTYDGENWNYSPKRFWPKDGSLVFFASYPENSILNDYDAHQMIYDQTVNPFKRDLLWGVSIVECAEGRKNNVGIKMVHALAKVNISFDGFTDEIGSVIVSAYKTGCFPRTLDGGIPDWDVGPDVDENNIVATFYKYGDQKDKDLNEKNSLTVFILPHKIKRLQVWNNVEPYHKIYDSDDSDASQKIKDLTFDAGKEYNLRIQKKNTNSRSIAMSVRCVSE